MTLALLSVSGLQAETLTGYHDPTRIVITDPKPWEFEHVQRFWVPDKAQVEKADAGIAAFFKTGHPLHHPLNDYGTQYLGCQINGHRCIRCFLHVLDRKEAMTDKPLLICDGGDAVFSITYDTVTKTCSDYRPNGYA
jgi:hypothetical protein